MKDLNIVKSGIGMSQKTATPFGSYVNTPNKKSRKNCVLLVKNNE